MRLLLGVILVTSAILAEAGESFPYQVEVQSDSTSIRSGPGAKYYETGQLSAGDQVEVYQRKPQGWLAIRPPEGSHSWVAANKLRKTKDPQIAKVVGTSAVAWIGSDLNGVVDHQWQVKLDVGESVQLMSLQSKAIFRGDTERDFYQIAPPAGEFRWVQERDIKPLVKQAAALEARSKVELAQFQITIEPPAESTVKRDQFVARSDSTIDEPSTRVASLAPRSTFQPRDMAPAKFEELAKRIDLDLSNTIVQEPAKWRLAELHQQAETLLDESQTTLHRGKARLMLEKVKEFETLQQRYAGFDPLEEDSPTESVVSEDQTETSPSSGFDPRFDGRGWLLPVHSSRQASPPYALLDQEGKILTFISPAPGLNLHRYLRKEIGIFGQRSRSQFLKKPHITANRIVDLDRHRR